MASLYKFLFKDVIDCLGYLENTIDSSIVNQALVVGAESSPGSAI
jgi:hypothetical protein